MFKFGKTPSHLDEEIDRCLTQMEELDSNTDEYTAMAANLEVLYKSKTHDASFGGIDPNTMLTVGGSLLSVALILFWEDTGHVVASKAMGFVNKPRI